MVTQPLNVLLAAAPPLAVLILMVGFRWGGSKAGVAGWLIALVLSVLYFGAGAKLLLYAHVRSLVSTYDVVYIIWMALLLYLVVDKSGGLKVIAAWFTNLTGDSLLRVLLLGWVFTSFLQGVGGFGVPVAIVAPILVGLGLSPLAAVVIASVGHGWSVTFGSMGASFQAMLTATGLEAGELAPPAAILLGLAAYACGLLVALAYGGRRGLRHSIPAVLFIGSVMAGTQYLVATSGLWSIGSASGGLAGLAAGLWVTRWPMYRRAQPEKPEAAHSAAPVEASKAETKRPTPSFPMAISGYVVLVILAVLITGVAKDLFAKANLHFTVPAVATTKEWEWETSNDCQPESNVFCVKSGKPLKINIIGHPGAVLLYSSLFAYGLYRRKGFYSPGAEKAIGQSLRKKGVDPAIGILTMVSMATIMANSGMTQVLAAWFKQIIPADWYAFVATAIGGLGAFMTGSNTNSNVVFCKLQMETAQLLGLSAPLILGVQTAAAAIASLFAPAKIIVGASTVGMSGQEGLVLRKLLLYGGILLLLIALLGFLFQQLGVDFTDEPIENSDATTDITVFSLRSPRLCGDIINIDHVYDILRESAVK